MVLSLSSTPPGTPPVAIPIPPIHAEPQGRSALPMYAPSNESGTRPELNATSPLKVAVPATLTFPPT